MIRIYQWFPFVAASGVLHGQIEPPGQIKLVKTHGPQHKEKNQTTTTEKYKAWQIKQKRKMNNGKMKHKTNVNNQKYEQNKKLKTQRNNK
jgi:hypothetical protein